MIGDYLKHLKNNGMEQFMLDFFQKFLYECDTPDGLDSMLESFFKHSGRDQRILLSAVGGMLAASVREKETANFEN